MRREITFIFFFVLACGLLWSIGAWFWLIALPRIV